MRKRRLKQDYKRKSGNLWATLRLTYARLNKSRKSSSAEGYMTKRNGLICSSSLRHKKSLRMPLKPTPHRSTGLRHTPALVAKGKVKYTDLKKMEQSLLDLINAKIVMRKDTD